MRPLFGHMRERARSDPQCQSGLSRHYWLICASARRIGTLETVISSPGTSAASTDVMPVVRLTVSCDSEVR